MKWFKSNIFILLIIIGLQFLKPCLYAQDQLGIISGVVFDAKTEDPIVGVNVIVLDTEKGTATDSDGKFFLTIFPGIYKLKFSMIGYELFELNNQHVKRGKTTYMRIYLVEKAIDFAPLTVTGERPLLNHQPQLSSKYLSSREVTRTAGSVEDVMRTIQTLPGMVSQADFSGRMYVRGGKTDENVVLLDRLFLYEPYHLNGIVSIFNPELIDHVKFYAGGFPVKYGCAMSSVLEVTNIRGNREKLEGKLNLSFISNNGYMTGPLSRKKGSWVFSMRRSYHDQYMRWIGKFENYIFPNFHDLQFTLFYPIGQSNIFSFTGLRSGDKTKLDIREFQASEAPVDSGDFTWDNRLTIFSLDWKRIISPKAFAHTTFSYSRHPFEYHVLGMYPQWIQLEGKSWHLREDATFLWMNNHKLEVGSYLYFSDVKQKIFFNKAIWLLHSGGNRNTNVRLSNDSSRVILDNHCGYSYAGGYVQDQWEIIPPLVSINMGLRIEYFSVSRQTIWSPRISFSFRLNERTLLKGAWGYYRQFPRDLIQIDARNGNPHLRAQQSVHHILGLERQLSSNILCRTELYYKSLSNLIVEDSNINFSNNGFGKSYGVDIFLQKRAVGKMDGWVSYSYSVSKRHDHPSGEEYFPRQDQRHTFSLVLNIHPNSKWDISLKWLFYSGKPYTPLKSAYLDTSFGIYIPVEGSINSQRFPSYHRLDIRIDRFFRTNRINFSLYMEILNIYQHKNVYDYYWNRKYTKRETIYQFPFLPILGFSAKF